MHSATGISIRRVIMRLVTKSSVALVCALVLGSCGNCLPGTAAGGISPGGIQFTTTLDFVSGSLVNVNTETPNQLQLNTTTSTFPFIWIALSDRGTICKIHTETGQILGEYRTAPATFTFPNPSRTTVGLDGSCWAGNRAAGSVIHVGLFEANQGIDRNGNGVIDTSTGYGDVLPWPGGPDDDGGVENAADEMILHFVPTTATATRHVTVDANNNVWVSGAFGSNNGVFELIDGRTGAILRTEGPFTGGYGGLVDQQGVIWSATSSSTLMRWDPDLPLGPTNPLDIDIPNYGLAVDSQGSIWVTTLQDNTVRKLAPDGTLLGTFTHGSVYAQGLAVDADDHVWIGSSFGYTTVSHLLNNGTLLGSVTGVGEGSTGVAVDAAGKIWTANIGDSNASRIDPDAGPIGSDGVTPIGAVDLTVALPGANPYNYSDMTGAVALGATSPQGTWQVVYDGSTPGRGWQRIEWNLEGQGSEPPGSEILVEARAADTTAALGSQAFITVTKGAPLGLAGRFIEIRATLRRAPGGASPILSDLTVFPVVP